VPIENWRCRYDLRNGFGSKRSFVSRYKLSTVDERLAIIQTYFSDEDMNYYTGNIDDNGNEPTVSDLEDLKEELLGYITLHTR
jgi:hypothetical protein